MGRVGMRKDVRLSWSGDMFCGFLVAGDRGEFSSLSALPVGIRSEAARLVIEARERFEGREYLRDELALAFELVEAVEARKPGRPTQTRCKNGHRLSAAYVDAKGNRQCRTCRAERQRAYRAERHKKPIQTRRSEGV